MTQVIRFCDGFSDTEKRVLGQTIRSNCRDLEIEEAFCLSIRKAPMGETAEAACAPDLDAARDFYMFVNSTCSLAELIFAAGHEMVHVRQYILGDLTPTPSLLGTRWRGRLYPSAFVNDKANYKSLPWEVEAHAVHHLLYRGALQDLPYDDAVRLLEEFLGKREKATCPSPT